MDPGTHPWNPIFFELQSLNDLNDAILRQLGGFYMPATPRLPHERRAAVSFLPPAEEFTDALYQSFRPQLEEFIATEFDSHTWIGLKDPRFCFLLPFWHRALSEQGFVTQVVAVRRSPEAVVRSNARLNGQSDAWNFLLVANHLVSARAALKGIEFFELTYEDLLRNPNLRVASLAAAVGAPQGGIVKAEQAIQTDLNHESTGAFEVSPRFRAILLKRTAASLRALHQETIRAIIEISGADELSRALAERDYRLGSLGEELASVTRQNNSLMSRVQELEHSAPKPNP